MAIYGLDDVTQWYSMPIRMVDLHFGSDIVEFSNIDESSTFELVPIFAQNKTDIGTTKVVAYKLSSNISIVENQIGKTDLEELISVATASSPDSVVFIFGTAGQYKANTSTVILTVGQAGINKDPTNILQYGVGSNISIDLRDSNDLKLNCSIEAIVSTDALSVVARQPFEDTVT